MLQLRISDVITDIEFQQEKQERQNKLELIRSKLNERESSPYYVLTEIENKLKGLVNLKDRFNSASQEGRRKMFLAIGENHYLNGNKLNVIKPLWLQAIQKHIKNVEPELVRFELENLIDITTFSTYFRDMFPLMCALVEEVRTDIPIEESKN